MINEIFDLISMIVSELFEIRILGYGLGPVIVALLTFAMLGASFIHHVRYK